MPEVLGPHIPPGRGPGRLGRDTGRLAASYYKCVQLARENAVTPTKTSDGLKPAPARGMLVRSYGESKAKVLHSPLWTKGESERS